MKALVLSSESAYCSLAMHWQSSWRLREKDSAENEDGIRLSLTSVFLIDQCLSKGLEMVEHRWWLRVIARGAIKYDVGRV
jgi:hypothetical protein